MNERNDSATSGRFALAIHGGAGTIDPSELDERSEADYRQGLLAALAAGGEVLTRGGSALDAVQASVVALEDCPLFNAGHGAVFTADGRIELDASIMCGRTLHCGAVIGVTRARNPIVLARHVMSDTPHVLLHGSGADAFAQSAGVETVDPTWFRTEHRWQQLLGARAAGRVALDHDPDPAPQTGPQPDSNPDSHLGTVGAVALDRHGDLAAATSTGGMTNKLWGRVGDSPIIGAGTYASNRSCAISATGHGEHFIRATVARDIAALMEYAGLDLARAATRKIVEELGQSGGRGGIIGVDREGNLNLTFNSTGMYRGWLRSGEPPQVAIF